MWNTRTSVWYSQKLNTILWVPMSFSHSRMFRFAFYSETTKFFPSLSSQSTLFSLNDSSDCSCSHVCLSRLCFSLCVDAVSSQHPAQCWPWTCSVSVCRVKASIGCFCICIIVLQFAGHPPDGYGIWFYHDCAPPTVSLQLLCLWTCGTSFWWVPVFSYWRLFNS